MHGFIAKRVVLLCCAAFAVLGGLIAVHQVGFADITIPWLVVCFIAALLLFRPSRLIAIVLIGFILGWNRGLLYMHQQSEYAKLFGHRITATVVASVDGIYDSRAQITFTAHALLVEGATQPLTGSVQISGFGANAVYADDTVRVVGKFREPYGPGQGSIGFAKITVLAHHSNLMHTVRRSCITAIQTVLPEPLAAFGAGLLIGQRSTLPKNIKDILLAVGLTHIIAVSGYNVTILATLLRRSWLRYSKRLNAILGFAFIGWFVLLTGASASISRAAIVSVISGLTLYYGRTISPVLLLLSAAAVTAWITPFYVWGDPSWYLSFLAFAGILLFAPLIIARWRIRSVLLLVLVETISAELLTIPYILATFGQISLIALIANVLVVSLVPFAMLATACAAVASWLMPAIAGWVAWPAQLCLTYMLDIASLLASVPHVFHRNIAITVWQMISMYGIVVVLYAIMRYQAYRGRGKITDITQIHQRSSAHERSQQMVNN